MIFVHQILSLVTQYPDDVIVICVFILVFQNIFLCSFQCMLKDVFIYISIVYLIKKDHCD